MVLVLIMVVRTRRSERQVRGADGQRRVREMERLVRKRAVILGRTLARRNVGRQRTSERLGVSTGALQNWERRWREDRLRIRTRGRPLGPSDATTRHEVREVLDLLGPFTGLPTMRALFSGVPRAELEELLRRYRKDHVLGARYCLQALRWTRPGAVWAIDFADPPMPIDGVFRRILSVRDLGSGCCLLWLPCEGKGGNTVRDALQALLLEHGAPLVLKSDNDSVFKTPQVRDLLKAWGIEPLLSPPRFPRYNGSCESGIGGLKILTHHEAARHDRPGEWSCEDIEAARRRSNEVTRPRGHLQPTAEYLWQHREPVLADEREAFTECLDRHRSLAKTEIQSEKGTDLDARDLALVERQAMQQALVESDNLQLRRRRISSPNKFRKLSNIMR